MTRKNGPGIEESTATQFDTLPAHEDAAHPRMRHDRRYERHHMCACSISHTVHYARGLKLLHFMIWITLRWVWH